MTLHCIKDFTKTPEQSMLGGQCKTHCIT